MVGVTGELEPAARGSAPRPSLATALVVLLAAGLAAGVLTSLGQTYLPDALHSLANCALSWSVVAFAVALLPRRLPLAIVFAVASFVLQLAGYDLASRVRLDVGLATSTWIFWLAAGLLAGPVLGAVAWWARRGSPLGVTAAVVVLAGLALGEGAYGLVILVEREGTTSPVWWSLSVALGVLALVWHARAVRSVRLSAIATLGAAALAVVFVVLYTASASVMMGL